MMKYPTVLACVCLALVLGLTAHSRLAAKSVPTGGGSSPAPAPEGHRVTQAMLAAAKESERQGAPSFRVRAADGTTRTLEDLAGSRPLVLFFIQDGCPCSESAQPFFNRLHQLYGGGAQFVGVIDAEAAAARDWAAANRAAFPLLLDPRLEIVRRYGAKRSTYVALIGRGGMVLKVWPGYSGEMLRDLGRRLAEAAGSVEQPLVVADAPQEMHSGCPY